MSICPTFQTPRLVVRELLQTDAPAYQRYFDNYEVIRQLTTSVPWPYPENGADHYINTEVIPFQGKDKWVWAVALREAPENLIGSIELIREATPGNRGFWLGEPFWGNGYMTEATAPITDFAFEVLQFLKLRFGNAAGNQRSARIKEKSGARLVERQQAAYVDPALIQRDIYELTREQWAVLKGKGIS